MRSRTISLLMLIAVLLVSAAAVSAQEATEAPADVAATPEVASPAVEATGGVAAILVDGDVIQGTFQGETTALLYGFNASEGDVVTISMTQPEESDLDPFLVLVDANGAVIAMDDDSGGDPLYSALLSNVLLEADGSYFVLATSFVYIDNILAEMVSAQGDIEAGQTFELTINGITTPAGAAADTVTINAQPIAVGGTAEGTSTAEQPVGFYTFEGAEGDVRTVTLTSEEFDTILHVFAPSGDRIGVNDDDAGLGGTNSAVRDVTLAQDGTYLIWATNVFFYEANEPVGSYAGGAYTLSLE